MKRLFLATKIELNDHFQTLFHLLRQQTPFDKITWSDEKNLHLTLRFIGKTPDMLITPLIDVLTSIFEEEKEIEIIFNRIAIFGSRYKPTVIWIGMEENQEIKNLFQKVEKELISLGFEANYGNFVPHLTLGRIKKIDHKKRFQKLIEELQPHNPQQIKIDKWILFRSKLSHKGPLYTPIKEWEISRRD